MKNTLLFFAILAFSMNGFAQSKRPVNHTPQVNSNSLEKVQSRIATSGLNTNGIFSGIKDRNFSRLIPTSDLSTIQVIDSMYSWTWDAVSIGWKLDSRTINVVYAENKLDMINYTEQTRSGSTWVNSHKSTATYDANHNQTSELLQNWNNNSWVNSEITIWTYDANSNQTSDLYKSWNGSAWVNVKQTIQVYDANNNLTTDVSQTWNGSLWANADKTVYTYDANDNMLSMLYQTWNGSAWVNATKETNTYNANNDIITSISQDWNGTDWVNTDQIKFTYDANHNLITELSQDWMNNAWEDKTKTVYSYDANNNPITVLEQEWDGSEWVNTSKTILTYDANKIPVSSVSQVWNGSSWLNAMLMKFGFDANNFMKFMVFKIYDMDGTSVFLGDSTYWYYQTIVTGLPDSKSDILTIYPNPSKGKFTISGSKINAIEIYNLSGKQIYADYKVSRQTVKEIDLSGYAKGIYILKIYKGYNSYTRKVIIQ